MSPKYSLNKEDLQTLLKVLAWSLGATAVTVIISFVNEVQVPPEYAFLLPFVNMALVGLKRFFEDRK